MIADHPLELAFPSSDLNLKVVEVTWQTGPGQEEPERAKLRDTPAIFHDWSEGGGVSQATDAVPGCFAYARNVVARFAGALTPSGKQTEVVVNIGGVTLGEINGSFELDGHVYFLAGRYVIQIANGTDPGPIVALGGGQDLGVGVTARSAVDFGNAVCVGTSGGTLWKKISGGAWTNTDPNTGLTTTVKRTIGTTSFWSVNDPSTGTYAGYYVLGMMDHDDPRAFRYCAAEPLTPGNWSAAVPILNRTYPVNALVNSNRHIWALTAASVVDLDQRNEPAPINLDYFRWPYDAARNGEFGLVHNGYIYVTHLRGLDRIKVGSYNLGVGVGQNAQRQDVPGWCDWRQGVSAETPVVPRRWSNLVSLDGYIVAGVWNGYDSYINFGRDRAEMADTKGPGPLAWWLGEYYLPGERITHIRPASPSGTNPRLWICSVDGNGNTRIRWASLPYAASPLEEIFTNLDANGAYVGTHSFAPAGTMFESKIDLGDQAARKIPDRYDVRADRLVNPTTVVNLQANAEDGAWVPQGTISTSPRGSALPTDPLTTGHNIGLRYDLVGTDKLPPIVREVRLRTRVRVEQAATRAYTVVLGPQQGMNTSAWEDDDVDTKISKLTALPTQAAVSINDEFGVDRRVIVEEGITFKVGKFKMAGADRYEDFITAQFALSILPNSVAELGLDQTATPVAVPDPPYWDDGSVWE